MTEYLPFTPFPGLGWRHVQTILAAVPAFARCPPSLTRLVPLEDGDQIACEISTPEGWTPQDPSVVTVHGLCGSHRSPYQVRLGRKLYQLGIRVVRVNLRGCGSGAGFAKHPYHAGQSDDVFEVIKLLHDETPESDLHLVGYSMGGNLVVKLAGELGENGPRYLSQVIAICPPLSLANCSRLINQPSSRIYDFQFVRWRKSETKRAHKAFPDLPEYDFPWLVNIKEFDDRYTAPRSGFHNVEDYYKQASGDQFVEYVRVPCKILFSGDDPIIDPTILDHHPLPPSVSIFKTRGGGHVGFVGHPFRPGGIRWLDSQITRWITGFYFHEKESQKDEEWSSSHHDFFRFPQWVTAIFENDLTKSR